ncbi:hypothetical protein GCM10020001_014440 [Nonomuraea salmonea]
MNMFVNAPGSTNTYGLPVSPATASAMRVLPVPGGPPQQQAARHVPAAPFDLVGPFEEDDVLADPLDDVVLPPTRRGSGS